MDVRFLIDEHIDHAIAAALKLRGYDALTLVEAKLLSADDAQEILPFAHREGRVLVTRDEDFLALHARGDCIEPVAVTGRRTRQDEGNRHRNRAP